MLAKWQAIPEPIIPDPITATFLIVRFIGLYLFLLNSKAIGLAAQ
jgi:hypothetical protein